MLVRQSWLRRACLGHPYEPEHARVVNPTFCNGHINCVLEDRTHSIGGTIAAGENWTETLDGAIIMVVHCAPVVNAVKAQFNLRVTEYRLIRAAVPCENRLPHCLVMDDPDVQRAFAAHTAAAGAASSSSAAGPAPEEESYLTRIGRRCYPFAHAAFPVDALPPHRVLLPMLTIPPEQQRLLDALMHESSSEQSCGSAAASMAASASAGSSAAPASAAAAAPVPPSLAGASGAAEDAGEPEIGEEAAADDQAVVAAVASQSASQPAQSADSSSKTAESSTTGHGSFESDGDDEQVPTQGAPVTQAGAAGRDADDDDDDDDVVMTDVDEPQAPASQVNERMNTPPVDAAAPPPSVPQPQPAHGAPASARSPRRSPSAFPLPPQQPSPSLRDVEPQAAGSQAPWSQGEWSEPEGSQPALMTQPPMWSQGVAQSTQLPHADHAAGGSPGAASDGAATEGRALTPTQSPVGRLDASGGGTEAGASPAGPRQEAMEDDAALLSQAGFSQFSWMPGSQVAAPSSPGPLTQPPLAPPPLDTQQPCSAAHASTAPSGPPGSLPPAGAAMAGELAGSTDDDSDADDPMGLQTLNVFAAVRRALGS